MQSNKITIIITTAILILAILTAGCTNPETVEYTPPPQEEVAVVEETAVAKPVVEQTSEVETPWYINEPSFKDVEIGTYSTLFGLDIDSVKYPSVNGGYTLYDKNEFIELLHHSEFDGSYRLDLELSSDQYRALTDQYGSMKSATMETIDLDRDGAMDRVAIQYVGSKDSFTYECEYPKASVSWYIERFINDDWDTLRPIYKEAGKF